MTDDGHEVRNAGRAGRSRPQCPPARPLAVAAVAMAVVRGMPASASAAMLAAPPVTPPVTPPAGTGSQDAGSDVDAADGDRAIAAPAAFDAPALFDAAHAEIGRLYPAFEAKGIDWDAVAKELRPAAVAATSPEDLGIVLQRMIARLRDSNATLIDGSETAPGVDDDRPFGPGLECRFDADGILRVVRTVPGGAADGEGLKLGDAILTIDGQPAADAIAAHEAALADRVGWSTARARRHAVIRGYFRTPEVAQWKSLTVDPIGDAPERKLDLFSMMIEPIQPPFALPDGLDGPQGPGGAVAWTELDDAVGYVRINRIASGLEGLLDLAVAELRARPAMVIDLRGTGGDPFDPSTAFVNFDAEGAGEVDPAGDEFDGPVRPVYDGAMIVLVDAGTIGAAETWVSWFHATRRARLLGTATAGAAARVKDVPLAGGRWIAKIPTRHYRGFLPEGESIEGRGIVPDIVVEPTADGFISGVDAALDAAVAELERVRSIG